MFTLGLSRWVRPLAYCEIEQYAQAVLLSRMSEGLLPAAPIWDDVSTLSCDEFRGKVDIISGGFPCTDISLAGHGVGLEGVRSGLFFQIIRLAGDIRPRFIFLENVPAITVRGLDRVLLELTSLGYDCRWTIVSAAEMGAPHLRERWFLLAHANGSGSGNERQEMERGNPKVGFGPETISEHDGIEIPDSNPARVGWREGRPESSAAWGSDFSSFGRETSDACRTGRERWIDAEPAWKTFALGGGGGGGGWPQWLPQPAICRGDDGHAYRMDALKCLGNGVPPQVYEEAFARLAGFK